MYTERHSHPGLSKHISWLSAAVLTFLVFVFSPCAWGQAVTATLLGTVTDTTGASVPSANVQIVELATGITHAVTTNDSGNYTFPDLTPGSYSVTVEAQGFKKEIRPRVDVVVNTSTRIDVSL